MTMPARAILEDAGLAGTHWGARIIRAEAEGHFTETDAADASLWPQCACGKADPRIPRSPRGSPDDFVLYEFGNGFGFAVDANQPLEAARLLVAIERRAAEVVAALPKEASP